jgi:hypothetical protein
MGQIAKNHGLDCEGIAYYLHHKPELREEIAQWVGISMRQAEDCVIAIGYGAGTYDRAGAIPKKIGSVATRRLFTNPRVQSIMKDLKLVRPLVIQKYTRRWMGKPRVTNVLGIHFDPEERRRAKGKERIKFGPLKQAHSLQGVEAQGLLGLLRAFPRDILLLEHDGFISRREILLEDVQRVVEEATGFRFDVEVKCLPAKS